MSTTEETTTEDAPIPEPEQLPDAVDAERLQRDRERYGEYRSLMRLSPINEAQSCETVAEVRAAITRENYRAEPRQWVVALLNERAQEVPE
jgi:hypothetical protein